MAILNEKDLSAKDVHILESKIEQRQNDSLKYDLENKIYEITHHLGSGGKSSSSYGDEEYIFNDNNLRIAYNYSPKIEIHYQIQLKRKIPRNQTFFWQRLFGLAQSVFPEEVYHAVSRGDQRRTLNSFKKENEWLPLIDSLYTSSQKAKHQKELANENYEKSNKFLELKALGRSLNVL
jgi:hypothetical protein